MFAFHLNTAIPWQVNRPNEQLQGYLAHTKKSPAEQGFLIIAVL